MAEIIDPTARAAPHDKQALCEEANRVTLSIRDARQATACNGQPRRQIGGLNHLYPTVHELANVPLPATCRVGRSLVPLLRDSSAPELHDAVLNTCQAGNHDLRTPGRRFMRYRGGSLEFYDMILDPRQPQDLAGRPEAAAEIKRFATELEQRVRREVRPESGRSPETNRASSARKSRRRSSR